jgi:hypothetical protein
MDKDYICIISSFPKENNNNDDNSCNTVYSCKQ